jgi:hypothetical protein
MRDVESETRKEVAMMRSLVIGVLAALATAMPAIANAETWCIRDSAGVTSEICAFSSAQDCIRAAMVGPSGGIICAPERGRRAESNERLNKRRTARLKPQANHSGL